MSDTPELEIRVNGEPRTVRTGTTIAELLSELGLTEGPVAVERNREVVRRADHTATALTAGDHLEIVTFFGGG